jgi:DNA-binding MarR family transcriptional regulator
MTNKQIRDLGSLYLEGDKKLKEQRDLLLSHKEDITKKIDELSEALNIVEEKLEKSCFL